MRGLITCQQCGNSCERDTRAKLCWDCVKTNSSGATSASRRTCKGVITHALTLVDGSVGLVVQPIKKDGKPSKARARLLTELEHGVITFTAWQAKPAQAEA